MANKQQILAWLIIKDRQSKIPVWSYFGSTEDKGKMNSTCN